MQAAEILPARVKPAPGTSTAEAARVAETLGWRRQELDVALSQLCENAPLLGEIARRLIAALRAGGKILLVGNGGSAAEAQHFAAELVGRFQRERLPYAALALT